jgi:hypothetical protein
MFMSNLKCGVVMLECLGKLSVVTVQHAEQQLVTRPHDSGGAFALAFDDLASTPDLARLKHGMGEQDALFRVHRREFPLRVIAVGNNLQISPSIE